MPAYFPVFKNGSQLILYILHSLTFQKKSLNSKMQICFINIFFFRRSTIKYEWNGFLSQFFIVIQFIFELKSAHTRQIHIADDNEWLLFITIQKMIGVRGFNK